MATNVGAAQIILLGTIDPVTKTLVGVTSGVSLPIDRSNHLYNTIAMMGIGTLTGGTILIEEADWVPPAMPYSGTWSTLQTVQANTLTGGAQVLVHLAASAYAYLRVRIGSAATGGGTLAVLMRSAGS